MSSIRVDDFVGTGSNVITFNAGKTYICVFIAEREYSLLRFTIDPNMFLGARCLKLLVELIALLVTFFLPEIKTLIRYRIYIPDK